MIPGTNSKTKQDANPEKGNQIQTSKRFVKRKDLDYCPVDNSAKFLRRQRLPSVLSQICGGKSFSYKQEVIYDILDYIQKNKLQKGQVVICDEKLKMLTKKKTVKLLEIMNRVDKIMS